MLSRLRELAGLVGKGVYALVVDLVLGVVAVVAAVRGSHLPTLLLGLAFFALLTCVAIYVAYQALRKRDAAKAEQPKEVHYHGPYAAGPVHQQIQITPGGLSTGPVSAGELRGRAIEGEPGNFKPVYVWDLAEDVPGQPRTIINRTLRYVELRGPALLAITHGVTFERVGFGMVGGNPESIIWPLGSNSVPKLGLFVLQSCVLEHCRTQDIGFTGDPQVLQSLRELGPVEGSRS